MTIATVDRTRAVVTRIERLDQDPARRDAVMLGLVDAVRDGDAAAVESALQALRVARGRTDPDGELAGWLDAAISVAHWALERLPSEAAVSRGTRAHDFLSAIAGVSQLGSSELRQALGTDETQVSRTGHRLLELGLVTRRKVGRQVFWQLTARGRRALEEAEPDEQSPNADFWREALRRGFGAVHGDEPGPSREVDPTRERIIQVTQDLHRRRGVRATTWPQIADKAGVPVETVQALFPTLDDLVRGCGAHFFEELQLPPADLAPTVFVDVESRDGRIRRLTQTFFAAYERGADGIAIAARERTDVPALDESLRVLEGSFDALVAEALRPARTDDSSLASVRALTDIEVWRALRDQGATPDVAVEQAVAAVERWLAAHPAR